MLLNLFGKISFITLFSFFLVACGGGGGSSSSTTEVTEFKTRDVAVSIAAEDAVLKGAIDVVEIQSPFGTSSVDDTVPVLDSTVEARNLMFAVTNDGSPMMMSFSSGETTFSVESTALALIEIGAGLIGLPDGTIPEDIVNLAKNSDQYNDFINLVKFSIDNRQAPSGSSDVLSASASLIQDVITSQLANTAQAKSALQNLTTVPFNVLPSSIGKLEIAGNEGATLKMENTTFLSWHLETTKIVDDSSIQSSYMTPMEFYDLVLSNGQNILWLAGSKSAYKLRANQDETSMDENINAITVIGVQTVLNGLYAAAGLDSPSADCVKDAVVSFYERSPDMLLPIKAKLSQGDKYELARVISETAVSSVSDFVDQCKATYLDPTSLAMQSLKLAANNLPWLKAVRMVIEGVMTATNGAYALTSLTQMVAYHDFDKEFEVCVYDGQIMPCVRTIAIDQEDPVSLGIGDSQYLKILAFGDGEIPITKSPPFTVISSDKDDNNSNSFVSVLDQETTEIATGVSQDYYSDGFAIEGLDLGDSKITITDPVTKVSKEFVVEVGARVSIVSGACSLDYIDKSDPSIAFYHFSVRASGTASYPGDTSLSSVAFLSFPADPPAGMLDAMEGDQHSSQTCNNWTGRYYDSFGRTLCYKMPDDPDETSWTTTRTVIFWDLSMGMPINSRISYEGLYGGIGYSADDAYLPCR